MAACSSDDTTFVPRITMEEYIANNNLTTQTHSSGLQYIINTLGDGNHPHATSTVTVKYTGKFTDDTVFDSSNGGNFTSSLNGLIDGWKIGVPLLSKGGSGTFFIPYELMLIFFAFKKQRRKTTK